MIGNLHFLDSGLFVIYDGPQGKETLKLHNDDIQNLLVTLQDFPEVWHDGKEVDFTIYTEYIEPEDLQESHSHTQVAKLTNTERYGKVLLIDNKNTFGTIKSMQLADLVITKDSSGLFNNVIKNRFGYEGLIGQQKTTNFDQLEYALMDWCHQQEKTPSPKQVFDWLRKTLNK